MTLTPPSPSNDPADDDGLTADEFNLWCALNNMPFRLTEHVWPDGATEWDVEVHPGRPDQTVAYGTGQTDEGIAAAMAFAFVAGAEWADQAVRAGIEDDDERDDRPMADRQVGPVFTAPVAALAGGERTDETRDDEACRDETNLEAPADDSPATGAGDESGWDTGADPMAFEAPEDAPEAPVGMADPQTVDTAIDGIGSFEAGDWNAEDDDALEVPAPMDAGADEDTTAIDPFGPGPEASADPAWPAPADTRVGGAPGMAAATPDGAPVAYAPPALDLFQAPPQDAERVLDEQALADRARALETVLRNFKVRGEIMQVHQGPVITLYELEPIPGTKSSTVINLADDIARSMSAVTARIAVVPGRSVIGIELPNETRETVYLREILGSDAFTASVAKLPLALGKAIDGGPFVVDLARMPHLLIAGTTGSGKSVGINAMILSLLCRMSPDQCRLIMVDPKMLELSVYDGIPHLLTPVVTDPGKAVMAMKWAVREMESRYRAMSAVGVRSIEGFNQRMKEAMANGEVITRQVQVGYDRQAKEPVFEERPMELRTLPYIVVIVDEMADLMLVAGKEIEAVIQRLAQMARAAGIHLIMATQRPSVDVITGTIKANFPTRVSFQVTSKIDSRTILGEAGAEQLVGQGDMLYMAAGGRITRIHGAFVSDREVEAVVGELKVQGEPHYVHSIIEEDEEGVPVGDDGPGPGGGSPGGTAGVDLEGMLGEGSGDELYDQAVALVLRENKVSVSFIQRHLQIGYNRSARIVERMESEGLVSAANHVGKRDILARGRMAGGMVGDDG
ncbi:DNA translocase FtsK [Roseospira visakhapatnamensis]|uniref:S-DNA-T family DNA segregation ATPase FtsK/SpoIIIE n=1 Tax=Roseospira visakhapatnamensis TaxID=390880 RepID=A0A7W6W8A8_9PROT|nr:DNA translocase FtsK [Roseospira visakhapatnamensis]MBB4264815.1 S-DNA-T family DNA segregation ATPase FtsK/SpoIIIE [Roseospira visakhapatnamensis]